MLDLCLNHAHLRRKNRPGARWTYVASDTNNRYYMCLLCISSVFIVLVVSIFSVCSFSIVCGASSVSAVCVACGVLNSHDVNCVHAAEFCAPSPHTRDSTDTYQHIS